MPQPLTHILSDALLNVSITFVGDNSELNLEVATQLGKKIGWFPVSTSKVLLGMHKQPSVEELRKHMGDELLGERRLQGGGTWAAQLLRCLQAAVAGAA
jgi:hypothetical protein